MNSFSSLSKKLKAVFILLVLAVIALLVALAILSSKISTSKVSTATSPNVAQVVASVSKVLLLPTSETPTLATVSDPAVLKSQPFFANAQKGDDVLIYTNAKKAILWRPSTGQVIEVSALNVGNTSAQ